MGSLFRSEEMTLCQLFLQSEAAYACVSELGELGLVQFRDLNPDVNAFQRKFVNEVRRCDEMERKLRYLEKEIKKDGIPMLDTGENPEAPQPREMIDLEATFEKLENELREVNQNAEALKRNFLELTELKHILRKTQVFFDEAEHGGVVSQMADPSREEEQVTLLGEEGLRAGGQALKLGFVAGVILRERIPAFERMLWRACRGNVFLRQAEIETPLEDPSTGDQVYKSVFIIFFQGDQLKTRVKKICEGFRATLYPCPEAPADRREMAMGVMTRIEDLNTFFPARALLAALPSGSMIHSYQPGLRLACGITHASLRQCLPPLVVSLGGHSATTTTARSSRSSASGRSGGSCVSTVGLYLVSSPTSKRALKNTMASVCIIGSGNWGSAIAKIVGANAKKQSSFADRVTMYVYEEIIDGKKLTEIINQTHENVKYLPGHKIPENVIAIPDVVEAAKDADILIFVVPHQFIQRICSTLQGKIKPTAVGLSLIKGFDKKEGGGIELISHIISRQLQIPISVLMGANLASEVADENFCETTIGCKDKVMAPILRNLIQTSYFRVVVVEDVDSVECCGALKNIVACGAGFVDGLGLGDNTKAAVIRLGLMEMIKFVDVFFPGGKLGTFFESCGVADLITTCYGGRNRKVSEAFVKTGKSIETLEKEMLNGQKLQGPFTAEEVNYMLKLKNMERRFPLFTAIHQICIGELKPTDLVDCIRSHPEHMNEDASPSSMTLKSPKCHL